jgi:hypothetical protein
MRRRCTAGFAATVMTAGLIAWPTMESERRFRF